MKIVNARIEDEMRPVPEREAAKLAGERFYWTGKPCRNGHLSKRYTGSGICAQCGTENTLKHQAKAPEHPNRIAAREMGLAHYSTGTPCKHGHDHRYVSNGICVECDRTRRDRYMAARPGLEAKWARERRAKDPTGHRKAALKWKKSNPEKVAEIRRRMVERNRHLDVWRAKRLAYVHERRARIAQNGGSFTQEDIDHLFEEQNGACRVCGYVGKLQIDHVVSVLKGGWNGPPNLQLLCAPCNKSKGSKDFEDWLLERYHSDATFR